jgi:hypothetical protein
LGDEIKEVEVSVEHMEWMRTVHKILFGNPEGRRQPGRPDVGVGIIFSLKEWSMRIVTWR